VFARVKALKGFTRKAAQVMLLDIALQMIGIWCVMTWMHLGQPSQLNLVELGPGRGTLMADLLRGTSGFKDFSKALTLHLVEVSPALREKQWAALK
jgi:NADH dehydrogenase [ubiquinone] 1 alpha subcomplex assembly factor 7